MHLFYNIDENGQPLNDTIISPKKVAAREIIQRENSKSMLEFLKKKHLEYDESADSFGDMLNRSLTKCIDKLFDDFEDWCREDFVSNPFTHLFELEHWEQDFISIAESLSGTSSNRTIFRNTLLHRASLDVLNAKLLLFKDLPGSFDGFQDIINKLLIENKTGQLDAIKRAVRSFSKDNANWTNIIPQNVYRIIETEQYLILSKSRLNDISNLHDALGFQSCFPLYKQLRQYEETVLASCYKKYQKSLEINRRNFRHKSIDSYILDSYDKKKVINTLRRYLKGKRGKHAVMVIRAAYAAGLTTTERIPFSTVSSEFGNIGVQSGYHHFFDDAYLSVSECKNLIDRFRQIKPIDT